MSFSQLDRITLAAKALAGGVVDADPVAQWYESTLPFSFAMPADKVWTQSDAIKAVPAPTLTVAKTNATGPLLGIISDLSSPVSSVRLTPVPGVNNTYVALSVYGDFSSALLDNWLAPVFAPQASGLPSFGYAVRLYDGNPALGGTEVLTTDGTTGTGINKSVAWVYNYAGGILLLSSDFSVADPYVTGFRYTGSVAAAPVVGSSRRSYGSCAITHPSSAFPATVGSLRMSAEMGGGHIQLVSEFNANYNMSTVHLTAYDLSNNLLVDHTQVFAKTDDIVTWVNANVPNNGVVFSATCKMEVYDIIDPEIVPPSKVYGKNRVWAALTAEAPGGYYHRPKTASSFYAFNSVNSLELAKVLYGIWTFLYGATMPLPATWTAPEFGCFWVGRNRHRKYDMPSVATALFIQNSQQRYARNLVTMTTALPSPSAYPYDNFATDRVAYHALTAPGLVDPGGAFGPYAAFSALAPLIMAGGSVIVGYPIKNPDGTAAIYLKPVGMDHFYLDNFDSVAYRMEAVGVQSVSHHPRINPLLGIVSSGYTRSSGPIDGRDFGTLVGYTREKAGAFPGRHSYRLGTTKFQYRDLVTGHVSPVSTAGIVPIWRRRYVPFGLIVRNSVDR